MKANELRLGNIIYSLGQKHVGGKFLGWINYEITVDLEVLQNIILKNTDFAYSPIPLTKEWLLMLGFNQEGSDFTKEFRVHADCYSQLIISIDPKKAMIYMSTPDGDCNNAYLSFPHFVHQIQNLYFALTGAELTI